MLFLTENILFFPFPLQVFTTTLVQTISCNYPSGLNKKRIHHQDEHWSKTETLILKILDRVHASNILTALEPNYLSTDVGCTGAVLLLRCDPLGVELHNTVQVNQFRRSLGDS